MCGVQDMVLKSQLFQFVHVLASKADLGGGGT